MIALIPARSGSKRLSNKNIKILKGHPLMAYSINSAISSKLFSHVVVSTESIEYRAIARYYGAEVIQRPLEFASDTSPDIDWVKYTMNIIGGDIFSILRPTSPFRTYETIQRAWKEFKTQDVDSLRAVEKVKQHPAKMWLVDGNRMTPLLDWGHSVPYQTLPEVYVQNASLEIAYSRVLKDNSISGKIVMPFFTQGYEGFDINDENDWELAERLIESGKVKLEI